MNNDFIVNSIFLLTQISKNCMMYKFYICKEFYLMKKSFKIVNLLYLRMNFKLQNNTSSTGEKVLFWPFSNWSFSSSNVSKLIIFKYTNMVVTRGCNLHSFFLFACGVASTTHQQKRWIHYNQHVSRMTVFPLLQKLYDN